MKTNTTRLRTGAGCLLALLAAFPAAHLRAQATYNFNLYAGAGVQLSPENGSGTGARFFSPEAAAVDGAGNIYVADAGDHTIRVISGGSVSTLAGNSGQAGTVDGTGSSAEFIYPYAVALDGQGNLYVADMGANNIRKVVISSGQVTTVAGSTSGASGSQDGTGTAALFDGPQGIAVDSAGNIYVADTNNSTIRRIAAGTYNVTTWAGSAGLTGNVDGSGNSARFNYPGGLAIDSKNNLYVADYDNSTIRLVSTIGASGTSTATSGTVTTFAGQAGQTGVVNGAALSAHFDHPNGVAVDGAGNVYVADTSTQTIREITLSGGAWTVATLAGGTYIGGRANGADAAATFFYPNGLAVTSGGTVYVADTGNHQIRQISGGQVSTYAGAMGTIGFVNGGALSGAEFNYPYGIAVDSSGNVYVADSGNNAIREIAAGGGNVSTVAGAATGLPGSTDGLGTAASFNSPSGVAVDSQGRIFVADSGNSTIRMIIGGQVTTIAGLATVTGSGDGTGSAARFNHPLGIAVDGSGNVYVADTGNNTIRKIVPGSSAATTTVVTIAGSAGVAGSGNGPGGGASFDAPYAVAVDGNGNVYVADMDNSQIREVSPAAGNTWTVSTVAGSLGAPGDVDGPGTSARFNEMFGIAADAAGDVYVADTFNRDIRVVTHSGGSATVSTINGQDARFFYPQGIAIGTNGDLYVADGDNQSVSQGIPQLPTGTTQMGSHTVAPGQSTTFTFGSPAAGDTYQWQVSTNGGGTWSNVANGGVYGGATTTDLSISSAASTMNGYEYRLVVSEGGQSSATGAGTLYVGTVRLMNLSTRGLVGASTAESNLVAGFYLSGTGSKNVLLRGIGPTLASYGVTNPLSNPELTVYNSSGATVAQNIVWGGSTQLQQIFTQVGAFALPTTSADSAIYTALSANGSSGYTAQVSGVGGAAGTAMVEIYDADTSAAPATRLVNISTLGFVGTGTQAMIAGLSIASTTQTPETVLLRGIGPSLAQHGVTTGALQNPVLTVYNSSGAIVASNTGWGGTTALTDAMNAVGAFSIPSDSNDSAILISLSPGEYTVELSGTGTETGVGLVEVYEVH